MAQKTKEQQLKELMEEYFYERVDAGEDPDEVFSDLKSLVNDDMQLVVEASKKNR